MQEYTNVRVNGLMVKPKFARALKSPNGHIYMKVLRERVLEELNLSNSVQPEEQLQWDGTRKAQEGDASDGKYYDIASLYNLNEVTNENAIGFN